jgi:hypothetical protein
MAESLNRHEKVSLVKHDRLMLIALAVIVKAIVMEMIKIVHGCGEV